ncbi:MAG: ankyrin repeat domain-containing protein [Candidatus Sumerlaeia bacterium]|nr:ankyrin repeat domain-containing protein [Candidatus Sumerlaeia bacterium]
MSDDEPDRRDPEMMESVTTADLPAIDPLEDDLLGVCATCAEWSWMDAAGMIDGGDLDAVLRLGAERGFDTLDNRGGTLLHLAVTRGDWPIIAGVLRSVSNCREVSVFGDSLLHASVRRPLVMRRLLEVGLDPNAPNGVGDTPLHAAARFVQPESVAVLLEFGADPWFPDGLGLTPLALTRDSLQAAFMMEWEAASLAEIQRLLVEAMGEEPESGDATPAPKWLWQDLLVQAEAGADDVNAWLELASRQGVNSSDAKGRRLLDHAAQDAHQDVILALLRIGARPARDSPYDRTILQLLLRRPATLRAVLASGVHPDLRNSVGQTTLWIAAELGQVENVELLLEYGANPWATDFRRSDMLAAVEEMAAKLPDEWQDAYARIRTLLVDARAKQKAPDCAAIAAAFD